MRRIILICGLGLMAASVTGCPHEEYLIELSYRNGVLTRHLTVKGVEADVPQSELDLFNKIYNSQPTQVDERIFRVSGDFKGSTPADIGGGSGGVKKASCSLGSMFSYIETFRGNDNVYEQFRARLEGIDTAVDLALGWLKHEFGDYTGHRAVAAFVDQTLRDDVRSLLTYGLLVDNVSRESGDLFPTGEDPRDESFNKGIRRYREMRSDGMEYRLDQFFHDRPYLPRYDPVFLFDIKHAAEAAYTLVSEGVGLDKSDPLVSALTELLRDESETKASFLQYIRSTDEFKAFEQEAGQEIQNLEPDEIPEKYLEYKVISALGPLFTEARSKDTLSVTFRWRYAPVESNGKWDPRARVVRWQGEIGERRDDGQKHLLLPDICYANWVEPNSRAQQRHFGRVALDGYGLLRYIRWYTDLGDGKQDEWDAFLFRLRAKRIETLLDFHFEGEDNCAVYNHYVLGWIYEAVSGKELPEAPEISERD